MLFLLLFQFATDAIAHISFLDPVKRRTAQMARKAARKTWKRKKRSRWSCRPLMAKRKAKMAPRRKTSIQSMLWLWMPRTFTRPLKVRELSGAVTCLVASLLPKFVIVEAKWKRILKAVFILTLVIISRSNFATQFKNVAKNYKVTNQKLEVHWDNNKKWTRLVIFSCAIFTQKDVKMWIVEQACTHFLAIQSTGSPSNSVLEGGVMGSNNFIKRRQIGFKIGTRDTFATHLR